MLEVCSDMPAMQGYKEPVSSPPWLKASEPQHIDKPTLTQTQGTTCEQHMEGGGDGITFLTVHWPNSFPFNPLCTLRLIRPHAGSYTNV